MRLIRHVLVAALFAPGALRAQHDMHHATRGQGTPSQGGQAAFAALSEIVKILEADSMTNWATVDLEALRAHLIDMDAVTLRSRAVAQNVPGGARFDVTGDGATALAIGRVLRAHAGVLDELPTYRASATEIPGGIRLTVTAERGDDSATVSKIRALGFAGLLVSGDHHAIHHLAIARGDGHEAHRR